jgi:uncharacterized protein (DUF58 family)
MPDFVFNMNELTRLNRLLYSPAGASVVTTAGAHRVRRSGGGGDFLDYREYIPGDDVRRIDWTVFARLRQPFVRVLEHEDTLYVNFLIDLSRSMAAGLSTSKAALACQLACGLAYVALMAGDHVTVATFASELALLASDLHGRAAFAGLVKTLKRQPPGDATRLLAAVEAFSQRVKRRGVVVILSDFLQAGDVEEAIRTLLARRFRVLLIQILNSTDWAEGLTGTMRLVDSETREALDVLASPERVADYQRCLRQYAGHLKAYCRRRGQFYLYAPTTDNYLELIARGLREEGLLR